MTRLTAELDSESIWVRFEYDATAVDRIKRIPGFKFIGPGKPNGPAWKANLEMEVCRQLRKVFGKTIIFSDELTAWGRKTLAAESALMELAKDLEGTDIDLEHLPNLLPDLYATLRGYQKVGAAFIAQEGSMPIVADQPGLGKTRTAISGVVEGGFMDRPNLVVAPLTSLELVWLRELRWQPHPVFVPFGGRAERQRVLDDVMTMIEIEEPFWLVVNPKMISYVKTKDIDPDTHEEIIRPNYPELHEVEWGAIIADEVHKAAMSNPQAMTAKAFYALKGEKRVAISGTPVGGKPIKLWGILHWLHPKAFRSKWRFADQWLEVEEDRFGKKIGKVRKSRQDDFERFLKPYLLRRTRREVAPEMLTNGMEPDPIEMWIEMTPKQAARYKSMALEAEVKLEEEGESLSATSILAEYTRLKQFADSYCEIGTTMADGRRPVKPTSESGKLPVFMQLLEERGITKEDYDDEDGEKVVFFSQFSRMIDMVATYLNDNGIPCSKITGDTPAKDRTTIVQDFQKEKGGNRVIGMTTTAGGVSIELDRADTVVFFDETWVPDDQEQATDRIRRMSRLHSISIYYLRSAASIEQKIADTNVDKAQVNSMILDLHREGFRATMDEVAA